MTYQFHGCNLSHYPYTNTSSSSRARRGINNPDSKVHGVNTGPTCVLAAPDGPHVGPMNLAIREHLILCKYPSQHLTAMTTAGL